MRTNIVKRTNSNLVRGWTRRAFCNAVGLTGLAWALPAYSVAPTRPWSCVKTGPAAHQSIDAHVHIFNGTDLQIAGFLKEPIANEFPELAGLINVIADPLQDFVWSVSPKAKDELRILNEIAEKSGVSEFSEQDFGPALQAHRAETQGQYNEFLRRQFRREKVRRELIKMIGRPNNVAHQHTIEELGRMLK